MKLPLIPPTARNFAYVALFNVVLFVLGRKSIVPMTTPRAEACARRIFATTCSLVFLLSIGAYQGTVTPAGYELAFQLLVAFTSVRMVRGLTDLISARASVSTALHYALGGGALALALMANDIYLTHPTDVPFVGPLMDFLRTSNYEIVGWRSFYLASLTFSLIAMYAVFRRERAYFTPQRRGAAIDVLPVLELALICVVVFNKINA